MRMRLLNLDRSPDRLALFKIRNPDLDAIDRYPAIDGQFVDREHLIAQKVITPDLCYGNGVLGNALSHLTSWRDCILTGETMTILEDDAVLCRNFNDESARIISLLPPEWEFIMWGFNFDAPLTHNIGDNLFPCITYLQQDAIRRSIDIFSSLDVLSVASRLIDGFGTVCYSISPTGASRLLDFAIPLRPMSLHRAALGHAMGNGALDCMLGNFWPTSLSYVAFPPLAITENDKARSTVC